MPPNVVPEPRNIERTAHGLFKGILFQALVAANAWLELAPNEVLVCEGTEDLEVILFAPDGSIQEILEIQTKDLTQRISAKSPAVYDTVFNFLCSFYESKLAGQKCRFAFFTTADRAKQQTGNDSPLEIDLLKAWFDRLVPTERDALLIDNIRNLVAHYAPAEDTKVCPVRKALAGVDAHPEWWVEFLSSATWHTNVPGIDGQFDKLKERIVRDPRLASVAGEQFAFRVLVEVMRVTARPSPSERTLKIDALLRLGEIETTQLEEWVNRVHPERLFVLRDLEARVRRLEGNFRDRPKEPAPASLQLFSDWIEKDCATFFTVGSAKPVNTADAWPVLARWEGQSNSFVAGEILNIEPETRAHVLIAPPRSGKVDTPSGHRPECTGSR